MAENKSNPFESYFLSFPFGILWISLILLTISVLVNFEAFEMVLDGEEVSAFQGWFLIVSIISFAIISIYFMWSSVAHSASNEKWTWFIFIFVIPGISFAYYFANRLWQDENWS
tara:strand:+ start:33008 stop:33349 length:342 start_codon:yes stop_codon:yes gene_type:complete